MEGALAVDCTIKKYLDWCERHRSPRTWAWYEGYLRSFVQHLGENREMAVDGLKPFHVVEWVDSHAGWGDNYRRGAIVAVQRTLNWAEEMGYIAANPVKRIKKPMARRREIFMEPGDYAQVLACLREGDPFRDLVEFVWLSGCRPQEVRHIEPRHVDLELERVMFPAEESKGKRAKRIIYLQGRSLEIVQRLMAEGREGKLFLNRRGEPWSKYAICNRYHRLSKRIGKRLFCYAARHGFATRKLIQGHDHLTVAALMGHTDGSMLAKVYSHIEQDDGHLKKALVD